ncbi:hypothetical protein G3T14_22560 [Methylobacterium sp. BTF04]|uniref:hypothetical protein n=1 Tax=Methylobacterium sp. BTF04 TaxID=2708300 RepID=UPI0013D0D9AC|nr:hypothetical protein [Methylobacterium sp. BTF04]NEU14848.1 hypothetical protein [Methylobacterium sp. BTF04]
MKLPHLIQKLRPASSEVRMPGFDEIYYRYWYRDVGQFPGTPLQHYLKHGWKEGRDPSAGFSGDGYLAANPDVRANSFNPLAHFLEFGLAEGRKGWQKDPASPAPLGRLIASTEPQKLLAPPQMD